mgnify:CR=1 FL=1
MNQETGSYFSEVKPSYQSVESLFKGHRGWALLRTKNHATIIPFLYKMFVEKGLYAVEESELSSAWAQELSSFRSASFAIADNEDGIDLSADDARDTIRAWAGPKCGFLRSKDEIVDGLQVRIYDIDPAVIQALGFVEDLHRRQSAGAETRIQDVFRRLSEAYTELNPNSDDQIRTLDRQIAELEERRRRILTNGAEETDLRKAKEKILSFKELATSMSRDFELLREDFKGLARKALQMRRNNQKVAESLTTVLDIEDELYSSDAGQSFKGYLAVVNDPVIREQFESQMAYILDHQDVRIFLGESLREIRRMPDRWAREVTRTLESISGLSGHIKKFMVNYKPDEYKALMDLVEKTLSCYALPTKFPEFEAIPEDIGLRYTENSVPVSSPMNRKLFSTQEEAPINEDLVEIGDQSVVSTSGLKKKLRFTDKELTTKVLNFFEETGQSSATAAEILERVGIDYGTEEVLAYLRLFSKKPEHLQVSFGQKESVFAKEKAQGEVLRNLVITFDRHRVSAAGWSQTGQETKTSE